MSTSTRDLGRDDALQLPSLYRVVDLRESGDAFAHAMRIAAAEGAGTLVRVRRFDLVEVAVVFEPEEPLVAARRILFAGMNALADSLAAHAPPERPIDFAYPDTILLDGGVVGGGRIGWPADAAEDEVPDFVVFGGMVRTVLPAQAVGRRGTSLEEAGFETIDAAELVSSFARHLMVQVHEWQDRGFRRIGERWLARLPREGAERRGIDGNGDLLVHAPGGSGPAGRTPLVPRLAAPAWLDPETGAPWL